MAHCTHNPKPARKQRQPYEDKPPSLKGIEWSKNRSGGWDCWTFRELPDGTVTDRQYLAYLGKRKWEKMKTQHSGEALRKAVEAWLREKQENKAG